MKQREHVQTHSSSNSLRFHDPDCVTSNTYIFKSLQTITLDTWLFSDAFFKVYSIVGYPTLFKTFFFRFRKQSEYSQIKKFRLALSRINYHNFVNYLKIGPLTMKFYDLCRGIQSCFDFFGINCSLLLLIFSNLTVTLWKEL